MGMSPTFGGSPKSAAVAQIGTSVLNNHALHWRLLDERTKLSIELFAATLSLAISFNAACGEVVYNSYANPSQKTTTVSFQVSEVATCLRIDLVPPLLDTDPKTRFEIVTKLF